MGKKMKTYKIAVLLSVPAENYEEALEIAGEAVGLCEDHTDLWDPNGLELTMELVLNYERDGSSVDQRVLYLHNENDPYQIEIK